MKKYNGYTLIEVLVALFIFTIVATITSAALVNMFKLREIHGQHDQHMRMTQNALLLLERDLEQIIQRPIKNARGLIDPALQFAMSKHATTLVYTRTGSANLSTTEKRSNLQRVALVWVNHQLHRENWSQLDRVNDRPEQNVILLKNVESLTWRFFDSQSRPYTIWPPVQQAANQLPRAIELTLKLTGKGSMYHLFLIPEYEREMPSSTKSS